MTQIFAFGHSITYGYWDTEGGWVQRLRTFLDKKALEKPDEQHFEVFNLGVSGNDTSQLSNRFENELEARLSEQENRQIIIFQIGANDIQYLEPKDQIRTPEKEFKENLEKLIEKAENYTDKILFLGDPPTGIEGPIPWSTDKHLSDKRMKKYNQITRKTCKKQDIEFIKTRKIYNKEKKEWLKHLEDGSHPDNDGHQKTFENVKNTLIEKGLFELLNRVY